MSQEVGRDLFLQHGLVSWTLEQVLSLARRVFGASLVAVETAGRHALVIVLVLELLESGVYLLEGDIGEGGIFGLLLLGRGLVSAERGTNVKGSAMGAAVDAGVGCEA